MEGRSLTTSTPGTNKNTVGHSDNDFQHGNENEHHGARDQRESQKHAQIATNASKHTDIKKTHTNKPPVLNSIKLSNNILEAQSLPIVCNMNPRSVYNKVDEFHEFVINEEIDIVFMSESWERDNNTLKDIISLENHQVISNVHQRKGQGGRPALIVDKRKFEIKNLTNTLISVKWGVEAVWALLTPKNVSQSSKIQRIACASIYSKPGSKHKTDMLDHVSEAFNILNAKYGRGLHFIIAGDTNELRLKPILDLSPNLVQVVTKPTRTDKTTGKKAILDPVIMTLSQYYQEPLILDPLDPDPDKNGKPSDHHIVKCIPISTINYKNARIAQKITVRPITQSGIYNMKLWLMEENWECVTEAKTADLKALAFQGRFFEKYKEYFPNKVLSLSSVDQPWITQKLKKLDRQRKRVYNKSRRSAKWKKIDKQFKTQIRLKRRIFIKRWYLILKKRIPSSGIVQ